MRAWVTFLATASCVVGVLEALAADPRRTIDVGRVLDAGPLAVAAPDGATSSTPADPPALVERGQWVFDLRWDRGEVWLQAIRGLELPAAQSTPRAMGRFALELFEGPALIERVRFDFPLLGAAEPDAGVSLTGRLRTRIGVVFPATKRGTRLELLDRATNRRWSLPWPPNPPSTSDDAGSAVQGT
ncbi:MAG: hypothetical protein WBY94_27895 [Polyangiaceae bacterium]